MTHPAVVVRRAGEADAAEIARVHVAAWREAYARQLPAELLAGLDVQRRAQGWRAILEAGTTDVWVADADGSLIGWATAGLARDEGAPTAVELEGIYVLEDAHGSGTGQRLLDAALGDSAAYLWVMADNPRAHAFYRRNGFLPDGGSKTELLGSTSVELVRLLRAV